MSSGKTTTVQKADPWGPVQPYLSGLAGDANTLFNNGGFAAQPYSGDRVAGFGDLSQQAQGMTADIASGGAPTVGMAAGTLSNMMNPDYTSNQLEGVKRNALSSAIPAATSMFSGSGMANSSQAVDGVTRAAVDAVAPYEYGAYQNAQQNALAAAGMAPGIEQAAYIPAQALGGIGSLQDAMAQSQIDADMSAYYEGENQDATNLQNYANILMGLGGQGGASSSSQSSSMGGMGILGTGLQMAGLANMIWPTLFASDRRLKENIKKIGQTIGGVAVYLFSYKGDRRKYIGVMADEVPWAIGAIVDGYAHVDYARVA